MRWKLADARSGERRAPITGGLRAKCEEMVQGGEIKGGAREESVRENSWRTERERGRAHL